MSDQFITQIQTELDLSKAESQWNNFKNNNKKIDVEVNLTNANTDINTIFKNMQNQARNAGASSGTNFASAFNSNLKQIDVKNGMSQISNMQRILKSMNFDRSSIETVTKDLNELNILISNITTKINGNNLNVSVRGVDELGRVVTVVKQFDAEAGRISTTSKTISQSFADTSGIEHATTAYKQLIDVAKQIGNLEIKIKGLEQVGGNTQQINELESQLNVLQDTYINLSSSLSQNPLISSEQWANITAIFTDAANKLSVLESAFADTKNKLADTINIKVNGDFATQISTINSQMAQLSGTSDSLRTSVSDLNTAFDTMKSSDSSIDEKIAAYQKYLELLPTVKTQVKELVQTEKEAATTQQTLTKSSTLSNKIEAWMNENVEAAKRFGNELKELQNQLNGNIDPTTLREVSLRFAEIQSEAKAAGLVTNSFASSMKNVALQVAGLSSTVMVVQKVITFVKKGVQAVTELDDALVDLKKTTTMSNSELTSFYSDANKTAKEYGATTQEIIQSAADWSRLGYSDKNSATTMAKLSSMMATISPGMSVDDATTGLVSIMKAYGIEAEEVLDGVMSKINAVGNTAATSNAEIITGLKNSASAMAAMDTSLDKTIALFTSAQEVVQDDSKVGNALRSISMRIRGYDEETEELSDDLATITGDVVDLTKVASNNYQGISLFTDSSQTEYKDIYDYLQEISYIFDELDAKSKQNLLEKLFGKNRASVGSAILSNFSAAETAMETMSTSAGSAEAEMDIASEAISFHLNELKETWVGVAQGLFEQDSINTFIDSLTALSNGINKVVNTAGSLPTIIGTITAALSAFKNVGEPINQFHYPITLGNEYAHEA